MEPTDPTWRSPGAPREFPRVVVTLYWVYVLVFLVAALAPAVAGDQPGKGSLEVFLLFATPVFLVPMVRLLEGQGTAGAFAIAAALVAGGPFIVNAVGFGWGDLSDASVAAMAVTWSVIVIVVAVGLTWLPVTRTQRESIDAVSRSRCGALLGCHFGSIILAFVVSSELENRGPVEEYFIFSYHPKAGDWRLVIPFVLGAFVAFFGAMIVDALGVRRALPRTLALVADGVLVVLALVGALIAVSLDAGWWTVFPAGGEESIAAAVAIFAAYLACVAAVAYDWRSGTATRNATRGRSPQA